MKVLIIDDFLDYAQVLRDTFRFKGHDAEFCIDSRQVLDLVLKLKPLWIVLDVRMPFKSGLEIFMELKEQVGFEFSAVFYSNFSDSPDVVIELKKFNIPEEAIIPKSTDLDRDVSEKLIPALEAGYLRGGKKNGG